ncbi:MAG: bifunctional phosphoglucose/phosphomannose isomerase [bacterium]
MVLTAKILDDQKAMEALDQGEMLGRLAEFPDQCRSVREIAKQVAPMPFQADQVALLGMGGSAMGGELLQAYLREELKVPFLVVRDYTLPACIGPKSLVLAVSYSGNTEETLSAYSFARERGSAIIALSSGGKLQEEARAGGVPNLPLPDGMPPRTALAYTFFYPLFILEKTGLIASREPELEECFSILEFCRGLWEPSIFSDENLAKQLAARFLRKIPVIYGTSSWKGAVALRWKCQLNENAKVIAASGVFPEMNHNELVGWSGPAENYRDLHTIILRDKDDGPRIQKRVEFSKLIMNAAVPGDEVWAWGKSPLARMFSLIYLGDYVSVYLALLQGLDPTSIEVINQLKAEMAKG